MSKSAEVLATLTAAAIEFALDNVEQFKLHMETMAREAGKPEMADAVPDTEHLEGALALAGLSACHAAEMAAQTDPIAALFGGNVGVTVLGPYSPGDLNGQLPPELVELLSEGANEDQAEEVKQS